MVIIPPHVQIQVDRSSSAGCPPSKTVGAPGAHGATVTGMHGMGVSTPRAAAVAEATSGLASLVHIPNGGMFTMGAKSMMVAAGVGQTTPVSGKTSKTDGATPKEQLMTAPWQTSIPMYIGPFGDLMLSASYLKITFGGREFRIPSPQPGVGK